MERRVFLKTAVAAGVAGAAPVRSALAQAAGGEVESLAAKLPRVRDAGVLKGEMLYRPLGATGETVSAIGLGGWHIAKPGMPEAETIRLIHAAVDRGITFMDNSWDYNEGESEIRMGKALAQDGYRNRVFLMTKIDGRDKEVAAEQLDASLRRLATDHLDLVQHHEVLRYDDPDRIFAEGGAMQALLEARKAGKLRYIGFTGHKDPHVHLYMLRVAAKHRFHFDTVQMPLNIMDAYFRSFARRVVPVATEQHIGVLGMKPLGGGDGIILKSGKVSAIECLHYALNLPTSVVITGIDNDKVLDQAFEAARTFKPVDEQQVAAVLAKAAEAATDGRYELFKTSSYFDATARHPEWLGGDAPGVKKLAPRTPG